MSRFLRAIKSIKLDTVKLELLHKDLKTWGLEGIKLRSYQLHGVRWLAQCLCNLEGCILGDEMGLGKTCQTISLLVYAQGCLGMKGPFLVLCPLSVMENWSQELERLCPRLSVVFYTGDKERRAELQSDLMEDTHFHILLTTYEICLKDAKTLKRWNWSILVVDEAHRLKNQKSLLYQTLSEFSVGFRLLLTGTPIQNNLQEVYSLLSFIQPSIFPCDATEDFVRTYADVQAQHTLAEELHQVLQPFLLRRVKAEVAADLPKKMELLVYHGMSALQKKYYKAILMKDLDAFGSDQTNKTRLLNILMQLRKCVNHPYLFDGVEPEPFEIGEHLVEASGKLSLLDTMLAYLLEGGHRILLFSQMTRMLDIMQDYLEYRGYSYERLDGSVRGEERNLAIKNFSTKDVFIFLLSTKAGGVGMNLTAADTVIFMDSDFNPQNDLQAAARAHRIGQTRAVKVIRLLGRDTVEEIIYSRAMSKLRLTSTVVEEGRFSLLEQPQGPAVTAMQLSDILKFGVDKLLSTEESSVQNVDLKLILGQSQDGHWLTDEEHATFIKEDEHEEDEQNHMYYFEGKDYSKDPSKEDQTKFELLLEEQLAELEDAGKEGRALRHKAGVVLSGPLANPVRRKRCLTEAELEQRSQKRQEAAAKRAKLQEEKRRLREEQKYKKNEGEDVDDEEDDASVTSTDSEHTAICYVLGDVTHPQADQEDAIIIHCVDDSGRWGRGGLFTALEVRTDEAKKQYELAGAMEDLELGNVLLFPIDDKQSRMSGQDYLALIVAQQRDKANNLSGIRLTSLEEGLKKVYRAAKQKKASVHLPRIGHSTKGFNWYGTERLIRKYLASQDIPTFIYYYRRNASHSSVPTSSTNLCISASVSAPPTAASPGPLKSLSPCGTREEPIESPEVASRSLGGEAPRLADFMRGVCVFFYNMGATDRKRLARYLLAYDGDEEDIMSSRVTHIVAQVESSVHIQELQDLMHQYPKTLLVKKKWLESCFANQSKVNTSKYIHHLQ
ncbi:chromodomain-helicase-DNA-binding protein 1-like isoform X2 [Electrophorus electricus]|uniref:chromodomain-helicase-DNA-binding protein 1-like isoform X2 n=1 Tax=Electrophorus electricus TaxID=8005 RepID=UPI0015CFDD1F|nr:chromodomain-helicase-DNA-binding protein 1-like isoform X2 [Electrophorus electricus]